MRLLGPNQGVVILSLLEGQAWQSALRTVRVEGGLLEVRWLTVASRNLSMAVAMVANRLREDLGT